MEAFSTISRSTSPDAIGAHPASGPLKRVLLYVVPYVTEPGAPGDPPAAASSTPALGTLSAALSLPRELPKLQGLERVTREQAAREQLAAVQLSARRFDLAASLAPAAEALFASYQRTRQTASEAVFRAWAEPGFRVGDGALAPTPNWTRSTSRSRGRVSRRRNPRAAIRGSRLSCRGAMRRVPGGGGFRLLSGRRPGFCSLLAMPGTRSRRPTRTPTRASKQAGWSRAHERRNARSPRKCFSRRRRLSR